MIDLLVLLGAIKYSINKCEYVAIVRELGPETLHDLNDDSEAEIGA
jgi:hypothetical protein